MKTTGHVLSEKPHEKCGVVAVWSTKQDASYIARRALAALQHRGQESAGITLLKSNGRLKTFKGMGLIPHVLTDAVMTKLGNTHAAIAHNRYSTSGSSSLTNAQPITLRRGKYALSIGHNGNLPNLVWLTKEVKKKPAATSDTALVAAYLLEKRAEYSSWFDTLVACMPHIIGAYCFVIVTEDGNVFGVRDAYGIRPFCLGKLHAVSGPTAWVLASESVALDVVGASFVRDIKPGEIIQISTLMPQSRFFGEAARPRLDLFEYVYFSRPDSFINGVRVKTGRYDSGRRLGKRLFKKGIRPDVVVPIFDSGFPAAKGVAEELGIPIVEAITTSHYVGRTFIQPGQEARNAAVNGKHNFTADGIEGKKVVFVDDSAVRLTTSKVMVKGLRECGVAAVYAAFASPPVVNHCDMGIDMKSRRELPASRWKGKKLESIEKNVQKFIGADALSYLPIEETCASFGGVPDNFYWYPFGGPHPVRGKQFSFTKRKHKTHSTPKLLVFISGNGSNLGSLISSIKNGNLEAEIAAVVSNNPDAYGNKRAQKNNIPLVLLPSKGKLKDSRQRAVYERELIAVLKRFTPDVVVLAGWMVILGNRFLKATQDLEIPLLNLHPALLAPSDAEFITTSKGKVPVVRGMLPQVVAEIFAKKLLVSGVTVNQVIRGKFDTGPIVLKEELQTFFNETPEVYVERLHEAEHRMLPQAIKRVLHVINHNNINVSDGSFPW